MIVTKTPNRRTRSRTLIASALFLAAALATGVSSAQDPPATPTTPPADSTAPPAEAATPPAGAATPRVAEPELPTAEALQAQLDSVQADETLEETLKTRLTTSLRNSLDQLRNLTELRQRQTTYQQAIDTVAARTAELQAKLAEPVTPPALPADARNEFAPLALEVIRQRRAGAEAELNTARAAQQALEATERERLARVTSLTTQIAEARAAADQAATAPIPDEEGDPQGVLRAARENERRIAQAVARQRLTTLQAEQAMIEAEADLLPLQIEAARMAMARTSEKLKLWNELLSGRKRYRIETELTEYRERLVRDSVDPDGSLALTLANPWLELISENAELQRTTAARRARFDELDQEWKQNAVEIERDLESTEGLRPGLGLKLLRARDRLPSPATLRGELRELDDAIERTRQLQTEVYLTLEDIRDERPGEAARGNVARLPRTVQPDSGLRVVDPQEVSLLRRLLADTDEQIQDLIEFKSLLELNRRRIDELRVLVDTNVVWIRDATIFRPSAIPNAWRSLRRVMQPQTFRDAATALWQEAPRRPELLVVLLLLGGLPLLLRLRLRSHLRILNRLASLPFGHPLASTVAALVVSLLLVLPGPTLAWVAGALLLGSHDETGFAQALGEALQLAAAFYLPLGWSARMLAPSGLAESHFGYLPEPKQPVRWAILKGIAIGLPLIVLWRLASYATPANRDDHAARLLFIVGMIALTWIVSRAFPAQTREGDRRTDLPTSWLAQAPWLRFPLTILPLILGLLSLTGYTHAAILMTERLYWSFWLALSLILAHGLVSRWLFVRQSRRQSLVDGSGTSATVAPSSATGERPESAVSDSVLRGEIDSSTQTLLNAALWVMLLGGSAYLWAPVLPIVRFLDRVPLWDSVAVDGTIVPITLANLVLAVPILFLTVVGSRNVPGLIEISLLEKLPLDKPARYAITSLAGYLIAIVGVWLSFRTLGLRWDSIQWLVAALSVGLGFGLQEIFANFVSGLILLSEQPIRVGDVVTIGNTTGTVTRIRIRSTVVRNWDRQELIIPNKSLITDEIINWTLSDPSSRIEIRVGVAYGSDTALACRLLSEICNQHEKVLIDPKPSVVFEGFGDSTLNLVARCFVGALEHRLTTLHELNSAIDRRFKEAGIEIAFPQQDIHIRSLPPALISRAGSETAPQRQPDPDTEKTA